MARVRSDGAIKWQGELVYLSEALAGQWVGIAELDCDRWMVRFTNLELGTIERASGCKFSRVGVRAQRSHNHSDLSIDRKSVTHASGLNCYL